MKYIWSDALILLAVIYAGREKPAALSDVIAAADYIQHAIVSYEEMEGALARLTAGGYIINDGGVLTPSDKTITYFLSITKPRRSVQKDKEDIEKFLGVVPPYSELESQSIKQTPSYPSLTRDLFNKAVEDYLSILSK